jgi:ClpP class serine protease
MHPNKKQALIEILQQLVGYRELAEGFIMLIQHAKDDNLADELLKLIYDQVKKIENKEKQKQIYKQITILKEHNVMMEADRKEADALLDSLLTMIEEWK